MDSITVMLFFATLTYELCRMLKIETAPLIITEVLLANIGGNFTPIGASANVVAYAAMEKNGHSIGWGTWLKLAIPATFIGLTICNLPLYLKYLVGFY